MINYCAVRLHAPFKMPSRSSATPVVLGGAGTAATAFSRRSLETDRGSRSSSGGKSSEAGDDLEGRR